MCYYRKNQRISCTTNFVRTHCVTGCTTAMKSHIITSVFHSLLLRLVHSVHEITDVRLELVVLKVKVLGHAFILLLRRGAGRGHTRSRSNRSDPRRRFELQPRTLCRAYQKIECKTGINVNNMLNTYPMPV